MGGSKRVLKVGLQKIIKHLFSIGKVYLKEINCDVIEMDTCHLLLGHPWQFHGDILYKGKANNYFFVWHGREVILMPKSSKALNQKVH